MQYSLILVFTPALEVSLPIYLIDNDKVYKELWQSNTFHFRAWKFVRKLCLLLGNYISLLTGCTDPVWKWSCYYIFLFLFYVFVLSWNSKSENNFDLMIIRLLIIKTPLLEDCGINCCPVTSCIFMDAIGFWFFRVAFGFRCDVFCLYLLILKFVDLKLDVDCHWLRY